MAYTTTSTNSPPRRATAAANRRAAFAAARRHSVLVRWLRWSLAAAAVGSVALVVALPILRPLAVASPSVGVDKADLNGTRVTMQSPRLSGYRADGRPYDIQAQSGEQSVQSPNIIDLDKIDAKLGLPDSGEIHIVAQQGVYDSTHNTMKVPSAVRITGDSGYNVDLQSADMDFVAGTVVSSDPVTMRMKGGAISADRLDISNSGQRIGFAGNVRSTFSANDGTSRIKPPAQPGASPK